MPDPIDTSTLGAIRITPPGPREDAVLAIMRERGCYGGSACVGECTCQRIVRLVLDAVGWKAVRR